jgi:hypothetical protein
MLNDCHEQVNLLDPKHSLTILAVFQFIRRTQLQLHQPVIESPVISDVENRQSNV